MTLISHLTTLVYVRCGDAVVLIQRRKAPNLGLWSPPGGKVEPGETPLGGALRELAEETGIRAASARLRVVVSEHDPVRGERWTMFVFRVDLPDRAPLVAAAEGEPRWVALDRVPALPTPPADRHILAATLDPAPGVTFLQVALRDGELVAVVPQRG